MKKSIVTEERSPEKEAVASVLEEVVRTGARQMFQVAIENEVIENGSVFGGKVSRVP